MHFGGMPPGERHQLAIGLRWARVAVSTAQLLLDAHPVSQAPLSALGTLPHQPCTGHLCRCFAGMMMGMGGGQPLPPPRPPPGSRPGSEPSMRGRAELQTGRGREQSRWVWLLQLLWCDVQGASLQAAQRMCCWQDGRAARSELEQWISSRHAARQQVGCTAPGRSSVLCRGWSADLHHSSHALHSHPASNCKCVWPQPPPGGAMLQLVKRQAIRVMAPTRSPEVQSGHCKRLWASKYCSCKKQIQQASDAYISRRPPSEESCYAAADVTATGRRMTGTAGGSLQGGTCLVAGATPRCRKLHCLVKAACSCQAACVRWQVQEGLGNLEPYFGKPPDSMWLPGTCCTNEWPYAALMHLTQ